MQNGVGKMIFARLSAGSLALTICGIFYLVWWLIAFSPARGVDESRGAGYVAAATLFGILGVFLFLSGMNGISPEHCIIREGLILPVFAALYFLVMGITRIAFQRPVTVELFLITAWTMMMVMLVNKLSGTVFMKGSTAGVLFFLLFMVYVICMVCYTLYYRLDSVKSYIDGCIPLVMEILTMAFAMTASFLQYVKK